MTKYLAASALCFVLAITLGVVGYLKMDLLDAVCSMIWLAAAVLWAKAAIHDGRP